MRCRCQPAPPGDGFACWNPRSGRRYLSADTPQQLRSFLEDQGVADAPLLWVIDRDGSIVSKYGVAALGATVGIDKTGAVRFDNPGPSDTAHLAAQLALLKA